MYYLGIYHSLYGDAPMTFGKALLIAVIGFLLVFLILGVIALFVKLLGAVFNSKNKKSAPAPVPQTAAPAAPPPSDRSDGSVTLTNVTEEEAALIMAIVSNSTGVPLSRLRFDSIRLLEDEK
ncbi:MAG: OadG family protein [Clostridia bacterium]|nr:OadG family protein [Clostridia bacterium]